MSGSDRKRSEKQEVLSTTNNLPAKIATEDRLSLTAFSVIEMKLLHLREKYPIIIVSAAEHDLLFVL